MNVLILGKIPPGHGDHLWKCREHESSYDGDHIERYPVGNRIYAIQVSKILYFTKLKETWRPYLIDRIATSSNMALSDNTKANSATMVVGNSVLMNRKAP